MYFVTPFAADGLNRLNGTPSFDSVDPRWVVRNWGVIYSTVNGLTAANLCPEKFAASKFSGSDVRVEPPGPSGTEFPAVPGRFHSHDGIDSAPIGVEAVGFDELGGGRGYYPSPSHPSKPACYGGIWSGTTNYRVMAFWVTVKFSSVYINTSGTNRYYAYKVPIPFDPNRWGISILYFQLAAPHNGRFRLLTTIEWAGASTDAGRDFSDCLEAAAWMQGDLSIQVLLKTKYDGVPGHTYLQDVKVHCLVLATQSV